MPHLAERRIGPDGSGSVACASDSLGSLPHDVIAYVIPQDLNPCDLIACDAIHCGLVSGDVTLERDGGGAYRRRRHRRTRGRRCRGP